MSRETTQQELAIALRGAVLALARRLRVGRAEQSLSNNEVAVLSYLARVGPATPSAIARAEAKRPQSLTRVFAALEAGGLVEPRTGATRDGREVLLHLTSHGQEALATDMAARDALLAQALGGCTDLELGLLALAAPVLAAVADRGRVTRR